MSKAKSQNSESQNAESQPASEPQAASDVQSSVAVSTTSKRWLVGLPGGEPVEILADSIEDAIRLFNSGGTHYARKQLTIVEG